MEITDAIQELINDNKELANEILNLLDSGEFDYIQILVNTLAANIFTIFNYYVPEDYVITAEITKTHTTRNKIKNMLDFLVSESYLLNFKHNKYDIETSIRGLLNCIALYQEEKHG